MRQSIVPWIALAIAGIACADPTTQPVTSQLGNVVVTSDLDASRQAIAPSLGADTYQIGPEQIRTTPRGENAPFQQVLLRAPGVVEDSFGQEHVRGEHGNLTYRVNGVILPEGLNGFGQELDTRLIDSVTLIDGALPAQFGFRTAGIVDVQAKSGASLDHNELSIYGGSFGTVQPSFQVGGTSGRWDYFLTGSYLHNEIGIENPTAGTNPTHDATDQNRGFGYFSYRIDESSRLSILLNGYYADFQIPDISGLAPQFPLAGTTPFSSSEIDENQNEQVYYSVVSYQKTAGDLALQFSIFSQYGQINFKPDNRGDLIYQGVAGGVLNSFFNNGIQLDASLFINQRHTLRAGLIGQYEFEILNSDTLVFDTTTGSDVPFGIVDDSHNHALTGGVYAQDEWRINESLTLNYGARFDTFNANFDNENQLSPRANLVYKIDAETTAHAGYARYFSPPPTQFVGSGAVGRFAGTTNAPDNFMADPPKVERSNYFDLGLSRQITRAWAVNVDGFYKLSRNLVDLGQFGQAVILSPFNYRDGYVYGAEIGSTFRQEAFSAFANFGFVVTRGKDINSQQFQIGNDDLAFIRNHYIPLDHQGEFTASAGLSYNITRDDLVYADVLYGSGLRAGFANDRKEPQYAPMNLGYQHVFHVDHSDKTLVRFRLDVTNVFDEGYQLRDGTGIGVGAPQFGQRRGIFAGVDYEF